MTPEQIEQYRQKYGIISYPKDTSSRKAEIDNALRSVGFAKQPQTPIQATKIGEKKSFSQNVQEGVSGALNLSQEGLIGARDFMFGTAAKTAGTAIAAPILEFMGKPKEATELVKQNINTGNIAFTALELYPGGGILSGALKQLPGGAKIASWITETLPKTLRASAIKNYLEVFAPTTQKTKTIAEKIVPGMAKRRLTAYTKEGLYQAAKEGAKEAGTQIDEIIERLPNETKIKLSPLISELEKSKAPHVVNGVVVNKQAVSAIEDMQRLLIDQMVATNGQTSLKSIRRVRQILDGMVDKAGGFIPERAQKYSVEAEKELAGAIREELARAVPDLNKVNAEYSFWRGVQDVLRARIKREVGRGSTITEKIAATAGGAAGLSHGLTGAVKYAITFKAVASLVKSTFWKTKVSAANKMRIADFIANGKIKDAEFIASKLLAGFNNKKND